LKEKGKKRCRGVILGQKRPKTTLSSMNKKKKKLKRS